MHNTMYPGTAKFQARPASPQFTNFSPPADYPHGVAAATAATVQLGNSNTHHHSMSMRHHPKNMSTKSRSASGHHLVNANTMAMMGGGGSIGQHRGDLIFPDDLDSIEFCMPPQPAPSNGIGNGVNGDMLLMHGSNGICDAFTDRRRRGHSRRSNHKMDVEQQVKWTRKNIAATMERFEPTTHSSSSTSSLEYGFAAGVVTPSTTPLHQPDISPAPQSYPNGAAGPINHVYSYAYYEPGAAKCHTNIPLKDGLQPPIIPAPQMAAVGPSKSPPRNSIRALLARSFRSRSNNGQSTSSSPSGAEDRHTYTTRYGTTENLYEEVNEQKIRKVLSDNRIASSGGGNVKEELRRVQHNHFRVLDELNLSLEALIMPPTPPDISPNHAYEDDEPSTSAAAAAVAAAQAATSSSVLTSQRPRRGGLLGGASSASSTSSQQRTLSHASLENLSSTLNSMELKEHHAHSSCTNPEFDEGDLDSGFSGSGSSSGASYNESLRYYKTTGNSHMQTTTLPHNLRSCRSSTASGTSTSKSSMASSEDQGIGMLSAMGGACGGATGGPAHTAAGGNGGIMGSPFNYARRCSDTQRGSARSTSASTSSATGTKPKKNFWTIKP